jgi:cation diffusion facilitator family transporter
MGLHVVSAYAYTITLGSRILTTTTTRTFLTQPGQWKNQNKNDVIDITRSRRNNNYEQQHRRQRQQRPTTTTSSSSSTRLYHMGHSHSHHDHGHSSTTNNISKTFTKKRMVRRLAVVLICWIATCGTKLLQTSKLTQNDWISFVVTSVALTSADNIKKAIERSVDNFRQFVDGIRKHSSSSAALTDNQLQQQQQQHDSIIHADTSDADRVTWIGVWVNLFLSVGKLAIGITSHSSVLVADAGHSLSDLFSDFITLWSVNVARIPPDDDHPYGHYKFEAIGSLFLSLTLLATGASVGLMANKQLMEVLHATTTSTTAAAAAAAAVQLPGPLALVMAGISIASKEWLFRITKQVGDRLRSPVVIANAWHHRSDAYSSILALLSIAWAMTGFAAADAAAGMYVISLCLLRRRVLFLFFLILIIVSKRFGITMQLTYY